MRVVTFLIVGMVATAGPIHAQVAARPPFVEDEVGGIRIGQDTSAQVVRRYGPGYVPPGSKNEAFCYWLPEQNAALDFRVRQVDDIVAYVALTMTGGLGLPQLCRIHATRIGAQVTTGKTITLGDSPEKVVRVYGQPHERTEDTARQILGFVYEAQFERLPGHTRWYSAILSFRGGQLQDLMIIESDESFLRMMRSK